VGVLSWLVGWLVGRGARVEFVVGVVVDLARYESRSRRNNNDEDDDDGAYDNSDGVVVTNTDRLMASWLARWMDI